MTELAMTYVANPLSGFFKKMIKIFESIGNARAAAELARMGYHEEAKKLMMDK